MRRHATSRWRKPPRAADSDALSRLEAALEAHDGDVILDSFCGAGLSTARIGEQHPGALVIGVDKSAHRLGKASGIPANCLLLQAHCEAIWQALVGRGPPLAAHYLLYPNPWPKARQLGRRVHGHPAFPLLASLGGRIEVRSNWQIYVEEFGLALHLLGHPSRIATVPDGEPTTTLFERKYRASGHRLWQLVADLDSPGVGALAARGSAPARASARRGMKSPQ